MAYYNRSFMVVTLITACLTIFTNRFLDNKCGGGLGGTTGSVSDSRSEGRGFDSH